ncbi:YjaG family protein [Thalassotalea marina]|uniref:DUF416 family protein n=1 Tax=Thalassotalea marina TaxID=1673741 RepID=A0A919BGL1_9GAMM|nr:YjaG family protein [Thalassotalea marina]GHF89882.1 hypothetical protein GCM10017161_17300 [Thalassotalea marina]
MIRLPFKKLSAWQQTAFCAALIERMLPNYAMFSQATDFGDVALLRNQLNLVWQRLDKNQKVKINYDVQLEKLEEQVPNPELFEFFGVFPALDTCMAVHALLQYLQTNDEECIEQVSRLSANSVSAYIELMLLEEMADEDDAVITEKDIAADPLMIWEKEMQNAVFDLLQESPENVKTIKELKSMVLEQGLSNLGLEIH